jgi:hypothetical protein
MKTEIKWNLYPSRMPTTLDDGMILNVLTRQDPEQSDNFFVGLAIWNDEYHVFEGTRGEQIAQWHIIAYAKSSNIVTTAGRIVPHGDREERKT